MVGLNPYPRFPYRNRAQLAAAICPKMDANCEYQIDLKTGAGVSPIPNGTGKTPGQPLVPLLHPPA
jgi:hypothetical protein